MNPVKTDQSWRGVDQLDKKDIMDGERFRIKWMDNSITEELIKLDKSSYMVSDMGHPWEIQVRKAYIDVNYKGAKAKLYLAENQKILCERI